MTATPPDPDPVETPEVGSGGGVQPGETPPDSGSTSQSANRNPPPRSRMTPTGVAALIAVGVIFAIFLVVSVVYLLQVAGVLDRW